MLLTLLWALACSPAPPTMQVAARDLAPGHHITPEDLVARPVPGFLGPSAPNLVGQRVQRPILAGDPVRSERLGVRPTPRGLVEVQLEVHTPGALELDHQVWLYRRDGDAWQRRAGSVAHVDGTRVHLEVIPEAARHTTWDGGPWWVAVHAIDDDRRRATVALPEPVPDDANGPWAALAATDLTPGTVLTEELLHRVPAEGLPHAIPWSEALGGRVREPFFALEAIRAERLHHPSHPYLTRFGHRGVVVGLPLRGGEAEGLSPDDAVAVLAVDDPAGAQLLERVHVAKVDAAELWLWVPHGHEDLLFDRVLDYERLEPIIHSDPGISIEDLRRVQRPPPRKRRGAE